MTAPTHLRPSNRSPRSGHLVLTVMLLLLGVGAGCIRIYSPKAKTTDEESATPQAKAVAPAEPEKPAAMELPPVPSDCPADLAVQPGPRQIDTMKRASVLMNVYPQSGWAQGHRSPVTEDFFLSNEEAVDAVIALEKKQPSMVPAGYRDKVKAAPKDAELRLHMARCELEEPDTRRRASYDAAMAFLLGAPADKVQPVLLEATRKQNPDKYISTCHAASDCPKDSTCDPKLRMCMSPIRTKLRYISQTELAVEHALTQALLRPEPPIDVEGDHNDPRFWWAVRRVHRCGGANVCEFSKYDVDGSVQLVRWDLRDGGAHSKGYDHQDWVRDNCRGVSGALLEQCKRLSPLR